ncbi:MAG: hypothetical protein ACJAUG_001746 [Halioglobus sp.]|jgi:uncharacterized protein YaiL (DUF2058 family)
MASLQDQLLKAGIVDKKKVKEIKKEQRKQAKQQPKGHAQVDEAKEQARLALEKRSEQDRQMNKELQAQAEKKAIQAQVIQLIKMNKINRGSGELAYQFTDEKKIKKLYVTGELQQQLIKGQIAITRLGESYELVPAPVAEKIQQRNAAAIVLLNQKDSQEIDADDPYADYQIPDDLMW